ncbi:hypothetical protein [Marinicauda algicola]|uniref:hypothetical protein n=1 Tax=Marinicauda algicola TaxID=2029849 RepID=UPI001F13C2C1|nr:hypothetical protein [Marinicauda algicola]
MEKRGARIVDISLARYGFGQSRRAGLLIAEREGAAIHAEALEADPEGFSETSARCSPGARARARTATRRRCLC